MLPKRTRPASALKDALMCFCEAPPTGGLRGLALLRSMGFLDGVFIRVTFANEMSSDILEISFVSIGRVSHFDPFVSAALVRYKLLGLLLILTRSPELLKFGSSFCSITDLERAIYLQPSVLSSPSLPPEGQAAAGTVMPPFSAL